MLFKRIKVPRLETERLILRGWTRKDAPDLYAYAQDPEVGPAAGWHTHQSVADSRDAIDNCYRCMLAWALEEKETGRVIGNVCLAEDIYRPGIDSKEIGYSLARSRWGKGYMPEAVNRILDYAFEQLRMDVIMLRTSEENKKSQRVAEKCRFTYEGTLRHSFKTYGGMIREVRVYSILRQEHYYYESIKNTME